MKVAGSIPERGADSGLQNPAPRAPYLMVSGEAALIEIP